MLLSSEKLYRSISEIHSEIHEILRIPVLYFIAIDQYRDDNDHNCNARYDDCYYGCTVCTFA